MTEGPTGAAPGWYPDPLMANTLRYWDGTVWTEHAAPAPRESPVPAPEASSETVAAGVMKAVLIMVVLAAVGLAGFA